MVDSDGITTSLFPVNASPAVPAPAPTRPPMRAPLPPPARPPIRAPPPAPPPINPAVRLPLPDCAFSYSLVLTRCPPIDVISIPRAPAPLNLPWPFDAITVPCTLVPLGYKTAPSASLIEEASTPLKPSPTLFLLALSCWEMDTLTAVPLGALRTTGAGGGGGSGGAAATGGAAEPAAPGAGDAAAAGGVPPRPGSLFACGDPLA